MIAIHINWIAVHNPLHSTKRVGRVAVFSLSLFVSCSLFISLYPSSTIGLCIVFFGARIMYGWNWIISCKVISMYHVKGNIIYSQLWALDNDWVTETKSTHYMRLNGVPFLLSFFIYFQTNSITLTRQHINVRSACVYVSHCQALINWYTNFPRHTCGTFMMDFEFKSLTMTSVEKQFKKTTSSKCVKNQVKSMFGMTTNPCQSYSEQINLWWSKIWK